MPFIRLSDNYIDHPKLLALSDGAFRLWHEGLAFCRKHQTDGRIKRTELSGFRYYTAKRVSELTTALWAADPDGYGVHDYLDWNPSRQEENEKREASRQRTERWRTHAVGDASRDAHVPDRIGRSVLRSSERESEGKPALAGPPSDLTARRAAAFLDTYADLFSKHRKGAKIMRRQPALDWDRACTLVATWDDARLVKLAEIFLTSDDEWIEKTDRGFAVFCARATWCDERLSQWEASRRAAV